MIRDFWVYQKRKAKTPWAIYIVKEFDNPQTLDTTCLDITIYSEDIVNDDHAWSFVCWHFDDIQGYVDELQWMISQFTEFNADDYKQLSEEISKIMMDTRN